MKNSKRTNVNAPSASPLLQRGAFSDLADIFSTMIAFTVGFLQIVPAGSDALCAEKESPK